MVYYTELTCDPGQSVFTLVPHTLPRAGLADATGAPTYTLRTQDYAVVLNGKPVGEKTFKTTCEMANGVSVKVDVDYGRGRRKILEKDNPEIYKIFRNYVAFPHFEAYAFQGEFSVYIVNQPIASLGGTLNIGGAFSVTVDKEGLKVVYPATEKTPKHNIQKSLKELQIHPFMSDRNFSATSN